MRNIIAMILFCMLSCFTYAQKIVEKHLKLFNREKSGIEYPDR